MVRNLFIVIVVILILFIAFAFWLSSFVMTGKRQTLEEALAWQSDRYDTSFYDELNKSDYIVKGYEDYELHGESLGAATTLTTLKYKPEVDFVVADCGFSDIDNVLREGYRNASYRFIG